MINTPRGERLHLGIFGKRNAGKSSLINALAGQQLALVSEIPGTTTDPVYKAMELLPLGPVLLIDTAGLDDDSGPLGEQRVQRSMQELPGCDLVLVTVAGDLPVSSAATESSIIRTAVKSGKPVLLVINKLDTATPEQCAEWEAYAVEHRIPFAAVSAADRTGIDRLKQLIIRTAEQLSDSVHLAGDLVPPGAVAVLVTPIDDAAPKGRLILPQVQTIRDLLDHDAMPLVVKERELRAGLQALHKDPALVITDSQAFQKTAADTPPHVPLTSFSILFARYKGDLTAYIRGIRKLESLDDGDTILIAESCTHHVQSDDIGTVKIPRWITNATGKQLHFEKCSGKDFPENLERFALIIQCGACMLNRQAVLHRIKTAEQAGIPVTNYGMVIAWSFGILERALAPFPFAVDMLRGDFF